MSATPSLDKLARLGVVDLADALLWLPTSYLDLSCVVPLRAAMPREELVATSPHLFALIVTEQPTVLSAPKPRIRLAATDGMHHLSITVFMEKDANIDAWQNLQAGHKFHVFGKLQSWAGRLQMTNPDLIPNEQIGQVLPQYPNLRAVADRNVFFEAIQGAWAKHADIAIKRIISAIPGLPESDILHQAGLTTPSVKQLLRSIHAPRTLTEGETGLSEARRLAAFSVIWNAKRLSIRRDLPMSRIAISWDDVKALAAKLPWPMTESQKFAIKQIVADLASLQPMQRLLTGDVGTGKTISFLIPAIATRAAGKLTAILSPNELLVQQIASICRDTFGDSVPVLTVTGSTKGAVDLSGNPLLIGTTALIARLVKAETWPDFVIVDEQQKWAVGQKESLLAEHTNYLEISATPIPRTTALVTHGGKDISILSDSPIVKNLVTHIVTAAEVSRLYSHTRKIIDGGGFVSIIYPRVSDPENDRKSVEQSYLRWEKEFPGRVVMLHGGLSAKEKSRAVEQLRDRSRTICIATSVLEIGIDIPDMRSMIVVYADRYGVSQLHQMRGRLARSGGAGYFFLFLPDAVSDETMERLKLVEQTTDGFALAERDADQRGYGDLSESGMQQHGPLRNRIFRNLKLYPADIKVLSAVPQ